jgi:hypothetical protein
LFPQPAVVVLRALGEGRVLRQREFGQLRL